MDRPALLYLRKDVKMCAEMLSFLPFGLLKSVYALSIWNLNQKKK